MERQPLVPKKQGVKFHVNNSISCCANATMFWKEQRQLWLKAKTTKRSRIQKNQTLWYLNKRQWKTDKYNKVLSHNNSIASKKHLAGAYSIMSCLFWHCWILSDTVEGGLRRMWWFSLLSSWTMDEDMQEKWSRGGGHRGVWSIGRWYLIPKYGKLWLMVNNNHDGGETVSNPFRIWEIYFWNFEKFIKNAQTLSIFELEKSSFF